MQPTAKQAKQIEQQLELEDQNIGELPEFQKELLEQQRKE